MTTSAQCATTTRPKVVFTHSRDMNASLSSSCERAVIETVAGKIESVQQSGFSCKAAGSPVGQPQGQAHTRLPEAHHSIYSLCPSPVVSNTQLNPTPTNPLPGSTFQELTSQARTPVAVCVLAPHPTSAREPQYTHQELHQAHLHQHRLPNNHAGRAHLKRPISSLVPQPLQPATDLPPPEKQHLGEALPQGTSLIVAPDAHNPVLSIAPLKMPCLTSGLIPPLATNRIAAPTPALEPKALAVALPVHSVAEDTASGVVASPSPRTPSSRKADSLSSEYFHALFEEAHKVQAAIRKQMGEVQLWLVEKSDDTDEHPYAVQKAQLSKKLCKLNQLERSWEARYIELQKSYAAFVSAGTPSPVGSSPLPTTLNPTSPSSNQSSSAAQRPPAKSRASSVSSSNRSSSLARAVSTFITTPKTVHRKTRSLPPSLTAAGSSSHPTGQASSKGASMDDSNVSSGVDTAAVDMAPPTADASNAPRIKRQRTESSGALDGAHQQAALKSIIANLALTGEEELDPPQKSLTVSTMRHQKMALAWMCKREMGTNPQGGILADDQGLGKTVSTISLIVTNTPDPVKQLERRETARALLASRRGLGRTPSTPGLSSTPSMGSRPGSTIDLTRLPSISEQAQGSGSEASFSAPPAQEGTPGISSDAPMPSSQNNSEVTTGDGACGDASQPTGSQGAEAAQPAGVPAELQGGDQTEGGDEVIDPTLLPGGTLVVCPTSVLHQWKKEIEAKVNMGFLNFTVHVYHGKDKTASALLLSKYSVVLTTYGTMAMEAPPRNKAPAQGPKSKKLAAGATAAQVKEEEPWQWDDAKAAKMRKVAAAAATAAVPGGGGLLFQVHWHRVVLDEAQSIKNTRTLASYGAWCLSASHRWCLSGTPIQNTIDDLYAYFKFLRYKPYCEPHSFRELLKDRLATNPEKGYQVLKVVLQAVLLRRTKHSTLNGEPIVKLPPREQKLITQSFTEQEAAFYKQLQADSMKAMQASDSQGAPQSYVNMLYSLLTLRQACNHPWLVKGTGKTMYGAKATAAEVAAAKKLPTEVRARLLQMVQAPQEQCPTCGDVPEDPVVAKCSHVYCRQCMAGQLEGLGHEDEFLCTSCSHVLRNTDVFTAAALAAADGAPAAGTPAAAAAAGGGVGADTPWVSSSKVDRLMELLAAVRERNGSGAPAASTLPPGARNPLLSRSLSAKRMAGNFRPLGPAAPNAPPPGAGRPGGKKPEKVIVFSQWTGMLDLLEIPLTKAKFVYRRLDGTMTVPARERAITDFEDKPEVMVLLVSLKAAALGVNLVCANHVVLLDLWWNPTTEEQAIDRAHRIGQTRPVHVTRITIKGTVEERILALQDAKRQVVAATLAEGKEMGASSNKLSLDDLRFLFSDDHAHAAAPATAGAASGAADSGGSGGQAGHAGSAKVGAGAGGAEAVTETVQVAAQGATLEQVLGSNAGL